MPRTVKYTSSVDGKEIAEDDAVGLRLKVGEKVYVADLTSKQAMELVKQTNAVERKARAKKGSRKKAVAEAPVETTEEAPAAEPVAASA